jgi:hypothetical protein
MKDLFEKLAFFVTVPYLLGLIITQIYISQYGIFELSLVKSIYVFNGTIFLLTITPGFLLIILCDLKYIKKLNWKKIIIASIISIFFLLLPIYWIISYDFFNQLISFDCYLYPKWYFAANLIWGNSLLVILYFLIRLLKKRIKLLNNIKFILFIAIIFMLIYSFFYGRTIFPALSYKIGGGYPREVELTFSDNIEKVSALIILETSNSYYYFDLNVEVSDRCNFKSLTNKQKVLCENIVECVSKSNINKMKILNKSNDLNIRRFIEQSRHVGF